VSVQTNPEPPVKREPNCKPGDPPDAKGLHHGHWTLTEGQGTNPDVYVCDRCGAVTTD
jgi:hypothetical protein